MAMMQNRVSGLFTDSAFRKFVGGDVKRTAMTSELHYAMKGVSDEAFAYVLKVAKSLAVDESPTTDRKSLVGETRVIITGQNTADVAIVWSFRDEAFLSGQYRRAENGGWNSLDGKAVGVKWITDLEERYQRKLLEVQLAVRSENSREASL